MIRRYAYIIVGALLVHVALLYPVPITFISPGQITTTPFSITSPGLYVLADDVQYSTAGGTAITINSSDVILDLNSKVIVNSGAGTEDAISLANTFTNVTIKNGTLRTFNGTGMTIPAGSRDLTFENITIVGVSNTSGTGFDFQGTAGSSLRTSGIIIQNCHVSHCNRALDAAATDAVTINDSTFNYNGITSVRAEDCDYWLLDRCQASFNIRIGVQVPNGAQCWIVKNSDFGTNGDQSSIARGLVLDGDTRESGGHLIENTTMSRNIGDITSYGLAISRTTSTVVRNCIANGNYSQNSLGIGMNVANSSAIVVDGCVVNGNSHIGLRAVGSDSSNVRIFNSLFNNNEATFGVILQSSSNSYVYNCVASHNGSDGFFVFGGVVNCVIEKNIAVGNGVSGFAHGAINDPGDSLFIGNIAFGNGSSGADNYTGSIPFLSVAATGAYPVGRVFDNRSLANLSFT